MRILFINSVVDYGSTGRIVRDLSNELEFLGHEVLIAYGRHEAKNKRNTFYIGDKFSTLWHVLMTRFFGRSGLHSKKATKKLIQKIKEFQPEVVHIHNLHGYYLHIPMLMEFLKEYDAKYIWTLHDAWSISGGIASFSYRGCKCWDEGCVVPNAKDDYPHVWFFSNHKKNFAWKKESFTGFNQMTLVSPSAWLKNLCDQSFLKEYDHKIIRNGIDTSVFKPMDIEKDKDKRTLLAVANEWLERKGLQFILELSNKLPSHYEIILIGLDSKNINELPNNIKAIKRTNSMEELAMYYSMADIFINPTLDDNFPTTNLESLACGTPVITFDTGGSPETIDHKTGIVTNEKTSQALLEAILKLSEYPLDSDECRKRAEQLFTKEKFAQNYINLMMDEEV